MTTEVTVIETTPLCGAKKRGSGDPGSTCNNTAGFKTDHVGEGRCFLHGGAKGSGRPIIHGRRSKKLKSLRQEIDEAKRDPELLDVTEQIALLKVILNRQIERQDDYDEAYAGSVSEWLDRIETGDWEAEEPPVPAGFISGETVRLLVQVQKTAFDMRYQKRYSVSIEEVGHIVLGIAEEFQRIGKKYQLPAEAGSEFSTFIKGLSRTALVSKR